VITKSFLQEVLKYHLVPGTIDADAILDRTITTAQTLANNKTLSFTVNSGTISINTGAANVVQSNVYATNGAVHMIDQVIIPPGVTIPPNLLDLAKSLLQLSMLVMALEAAGLDESLTGEVPYYPYTVFAPTNATFAALPNGTLDTLLADPQGQLANVLKYHLIWNQVVSASEAIRLAGFNGLLSMMNHQNCNSHL